MHSTGTAPEKIRMITEKHVKKDVKSELKKKKLNTIIRKMHITTTLRYHFTATKMAKIKHWPYQVSQKMWRNWNLNTSWECEISQPLGKSDWQFLKKLNIHLPYVRSSHFTPRYLPKRKHSCTQRLAMKTWELGFLFLSGNFFSGQEMFLI